MNTETPPCRLFLLLARSAKRAVIFRRGPTKWFQLILWHTDADQFDFGQWFSGKIFVRRSDLSPDGTKLIYFALKKNPRTIREPEFQYSHGAYCWTAISKPPFYTALALWPKAGSWEGGGLFENDNEVLLNHKPEQAQPHPKHIPQGLKIIPDPETHGEDEYIYSKRLTRDGWQVIQEWKISFEGFQFNTEIPGIRFRQHPHKPFRVVMKQRMDGFKYRELFSVETLDQQPLVNVEGSDWVDWDQNGRLIVLKQGKVFIGIESGAEFTLRELVDFNSQKPEHILSPQWANEW